MKIGMNAHPFWSAKLPSEWFVPWLDEVAAAGMTVLRFDMAWTPFPPINQIVDLMALLAARGITPLVSLAGTGKIWLAPDPWQYAVVAAKLAPLLPPGGMLEVWNEPNLERFWPKPDPVQYAQLVYVTKAAVSHAAPGVEVLAGAIAFRDEPYLNGFFNAQPAPRFDAFSFHPYTGTLSPDQRVDTWKSLPLFLELLAAKLPDTPLIISEMGWECDTPEKDGQAASYYRAACQIASERVSAYCAYHLGDRAQSGAEPPTSLLKPDRSHTLSWNALARQGQDA